MEDYTEEGLPTMYYLDLDTTALPCSLICPSGHYGIGSTTVHVMHYI